MSKIQSENRQLKQRSDFAEGIINTLRDPLVILDTELNVLAANESFFKNFASTGDEVHGRSFFDIYGGIWNQAILKQTLVKTLQENTPFHDYVLQPDVAGHRHKTLLLNGRRIYEQGEETGQILVVIEDITLRRHQEKAMRFQADALNRVNDAVLAIDGEGYLFYWNCRAATLLKIPSDTTDRIRLDDICIKIEGNLPGFSPFLLPNNRGESIVFALKNLTKNSI